MLQRAYINGHERREFRAYGIPLHPLTLGHIQLLAEMDCNVPFPPLVLEIEDIGKVVSVCAYPDWRDARERITSDINDLTRTIVNALEPDNKAAITTIGEYLAYYLAKPRMRVESSEWADSRVPWWWSYAEFMQTEMGRDEIDAWNTTVCDAFAYFTCWANRGGDDRIMTVREVLIEDQVRAGKTADDIIKGAA